jgi:uncharacterized protein (DUF305 family)
MERRGCGESTRINVRAGKWPGSCIARRMEHHQKQHPNHYARLAIMAALSFLAMYGLMYAMVDSISNVYMNVNQIYMAALMTAPMVAIELIVMRMMYEDARLNRLIMAASVIVGVAAFVLIRQQAAVGDRQFLRSMIPHHGGAILMCQEAPIADSEIRLLCQDILSSQQREIDQMKAALNRLR